MPSVVFSHPPIGTVGLTEEEAVTCYGRNNIKIYSTTAINSFYGVFPADKKAKTLIKLITTVSSGADDYYAQGPEETCIGIHIIGMNVDEVIQGFAVVVANALPKSVLDNTTAIHPTLAEELVTLH